MARSKIAGDTDTVRSSYLTCMEEFLDNIYEPGSMLPPSVVSMMCAMTDRLGREIAVYLDRSNRVLQIAVGDAVHVELPEAGGRQKEGRLCGIRLLHTHPAGSLLPSDADLRSLRSLRLDAMAVIGAGRGATVSVLQRDSRGMLHRTATYGPLPLSRTAEFDGIFAEIEATDRSAPDNPQQNRTERERALLVSISGPPDELRELARSAGAEVVGEIVQKRETPDVKYYIGRGLASELADTVREKKADLILFDDELSAAQIRNLEDAGGVRVIDRTALILDIFAARAKSREGRLQVELAQQKYRLPRLTGKGTEMSRLGGGIGTRGPGETKLESDRRHIYRKIHQLEAQLREVASRRDFLRQQRRKRDLPVIAVVGYTNAGKSTLLNSLCDADVYVEDALFATLDPSVRRMTGSGNRDYLLVDTVGFIRKLPHDLIEAFKSTLEEAVYADLLLHVVDASAPDYEDSILVVEKILDEIGAGARPRYLVLNQVDRLPAGAQIPVPESVRRGYGRVLQVSATAGTGLPALRDAIVRHFTRAERHFRFRIPYGQGAALARLHREGTVEREEWTESGAIVEGTLPPEVYADMRQYATEI